VLAATVQAGPAVLAVTLGVQADPVADDERRLLEEVESDGD